MHAFTRGPWVAEKSVDEFYAQHIKPLPPESRRRLLALMALDLAGADAGPAPQGRSLLELEGLGSEIWQAVDAEGYVRGLREEWTQHH